jgi:hypothetical protein
MNCKKNKFWVENIFSLDQTHDQLVSNMNFLSLVAVVLFFILYILKYDYVILLFCITIIFIIIIYYIQKEMIQKENFNYSSSTYSYKKSSDLEIIYNNTPSTSTSKRFENTINVEDEYSNKKPSLNQRLVGPPNPKTLEAPVIAPPCYNFEHWKVNNLAVPSHINKNSNFDNFRSGYAVASSSSRPPLVQTPVSMSNTPMANAPNTPMSKGSNNLMVKGSLLDSSLEPLTSNADAHPTIKYPNNTIGGRGLTDEEKKNMYTQIIQPGIYSTSAMNEPIGSNLGISHQQQFLPTYIDRKKQGEINYVETHGVLINSDIDHTNPHQPTVYNTFDPRFNGYGSDNRCYIENTTGQPRFYYDDINAIKMPNYITRSNIDFMKAADSYGPIQEGYQYGNPNTCDIREMAEANFLNSTLQFRSEMQESLMRKRNGEMHQLRLAPISRNQQKAHGGMGRF